MTRLGVATDRGHAIPRRVSPVIENRTLPAASARPSASGAEALANSKDHRTEGARVSWLICPGGATNHGGIGVEIVAASLTRHVVA